MTEIGRIIGSIVICTVLGMIGLAALKAGARVLRVARSRVRGWRDLRKLRPYEAQFRSPQRTGRGER